MSIQKLLGKSQNFPTKSHISQFAFFNQRHSFKSLLLPQFLSDRRATLTDCRKRYFYLILEAEFLNFARVGIFGHFKIFSREKNENRPKIPTRAKIQNSASKNNPEKRFLITGFSFATIE